MEANPGTVTLESLERYRRAGVNRLSYGAQSFQPAELTWLGRQHSVGDIEDAVRKARTAGFQRLNLDLIYGLPEQPLASWEASLLQTLALQVDHLSLYALTIEEGTPLGKWVAQGTVPLPDPDLAADQYLAADAALTADGYHQYEISNWAAARSGVPPQPYLLAQPTLRGPRRGRALLLRRLPLQRHTPAAGVHRAVE